MSSGRINLDTISKEMQLDRDAQTRIMDTYGPAYKELLGYMPPRVEARFGITGVIDPELVELQEKMRSHAMDTTVLDPKITQLVLFGMLLMDGNDAAQTHCIAARRANATWAELQAIISLCFLFRGLPAANRGAEMLGKVAEREAEMAAAQKAS
jgi:alkylhydroperoxidase/carboxymuconolactone decarboxylase family protein YurZ